MTLETIFTEENINKALEHILSRKNSCGVDGIYITDFGEYWLMNGEKIIRQLLRGKYKNSPIQIHDRVMPTGKHRKIALYTCTDRLITRILSDTLQR